MAFFRDPGEMFLGCLGTVEQRYLVNLIKNAAKNGYTRFVEPCAGTFAMSNLAIQNGYKPEQIETSDVSMMSSVMGYAITGKPLDELEIHAQGFSDEELLDPAVALYAQMYLRTSKTAGNEYFFNLLKDLRDRREEHIEHIRQSLENIKKEMYGMTYRPLDMWDHLDEVLDDPHTLVIANPPTYFSGYTTGIRRRKPEQKCSMVRSCKYRNTECPHLGWHRKFSVKILSDTFAGSKSRRMRNGEG